MHQHCSKPGSALSYRLRIRWWFKWMRPKEGETINLNLSVNGVIARIMPYNKFKVFVYCSLEIILMATVKMEELRVSFQQLHNFRWQKEREIVSGQFNATKDFGIVWFIKMFDRVKRRLQDRIEVIYWILNTHNVYCFVNCFIGA